MSSTRLTGLVLDLRNDPGGLLKSAVDLSSDFLEGGSIVSMHGRDKSDNRSFEAAATGTLLPKTPMVVLVNGASASASEIVAGEPKKKTASAETASPPIKEELIGTDKDAQLAAALHLLKRLPAENSAAVGANGL